MTPEKALERLQGRVPPKQMPTATLDEKRTFSSIKGPPFKDMKTPKGMSMAGTGRDLDFIKILSVVLILAVLVIVRSWKPAAVSESSYKNGFNDGVASVSAGLALAQKQINGQLQQIDGLQQDLTGSNENLIRLQQVLEKTKSDLYDTTRQKENLAESLRETHDSIPGKISAVQQPLEDKIRRLKEDYKKRTRRLTEQFRKKISDLSAQLAAAQKEADMQQEQLGSLQKMTEQNQREQEQTLQAAVDKERQLEAAQQDLKAHAQQLDKLQQDLNKSVLEKALWQQQISSAREDLKSAGEQNDRLMRTLRQTQESIPGSISAAQRPLQKRIEELDRQLNIVLGQQRPRDGNMCR